jgi:hypothetical protein
MFIVSAAQCATVSGDADGPVRVIGLPQNPGVVTSAEFVETVRRHKDTVETVGLTYFSTTTYSFSSREMLDLVDVLKEAPNLKSIDLWETALTEVNLLLLTDGLKGHPSLEFIRMCYRSKVLSEALTDNLIELMRSCPNLCGVLTRGGDRSQAHNSNELKLYVAACELRRGHVLPCDYGYSEIVVPEEWLERAKVHKGRKDHPHGWCGVLKGGLLVFAKQTDSENYSEYQPVEGQDYFEKPRNGTFVQIQYGNEVTDNIQAPYLVPNRGVCGGPIVFNTLGDLQRYFAKKRMEGAYEHVIRGFKSGISTPELWQ